MKHLLLLLLGSMPCALSAKAEYYEAAKEKYSQALRIKSDPAVKQKLNALP